MRIPALCEYIFCSPIFGIILILDSTQGSVSNEEKKPNIVIIIADDMGFNDVGIHGSDQIPTPNIDALSYFGIGLNRYYVAPMCTPSRASLMTGKYPSNIGMQHFVIPSDEPWGLGLNQKLLPEYMKKGGYDTYMIGKWHLGFFEKLYTPTFRGFDSFHGFLGPYIDYYNHSLTRIGTPWKLENGYDMRKNVTINYDSMGIYATDLFTDIAIKTIQTHDHNKPFFMYLSHLAPHAGNFYDLLQIPANDKNNFLYIKDENRRKYAAIVARLDKGIGRVVQALNDNDMLNNTIILFFSDNGSPILGEHSNGGSNSPFRGQKDTPWEGAVRTNAAIWSQSIKTKQRISNQLIHISDWLPTFAHIAGVEIVEPIDGTNMWDALSLNLNSSRNEVLCNLDDTFPYSSYINGDWKIVNGTTYDGLHDGWLSSFDETEKHPSFFHYGLSILDSDVGKALMPYSPDSDLRFSNKLSITDIELLRKQSKVICKSSISSENFIKCEPIKSPCLFNIKEDPCEEDNLAVLHPEKMNFMLTEVERFKKTAVPPRNQPSDPNCNPAYFNKTWTWWYEEVKTGYPSSALHYSYGVLHYLWLFILVLQILLQ